MENKAELIEKLTKKLSKKKSALSMQASRLKKQEKNTITTDQAYLFLASENGIDVSKYASDDELILIRNLHSKKQKTTEPSPKLEKNNNKRKKSTPSLNDPLLPEKVLKEADAMSEVYPIVYVLEHSIRNYLDLILSKKYGKKWLESNGPKKEWYYAKANMERDEKKKWFQKVGDKQIDYLDFDRLKKIVNHHHSILIPRFIESVDWFRGFIDEVYPARCCLAHNNPLSSTTIKSIKVKLEQWQKVVRENKNAI